MMKLYVGNLPFSSTDSSLEEMFTEYGTVHSSKVITDRETGRSRGFGFVEMDEDAGKQAIETMHGKEIDGRAVVVNEARPREARPPRY